MSDQFRTALGRAEERLTAQQDRLFQRIEDKLERLEAKFDLRIDASDRDTQREFGEVRRDVGELRDLVSKHGNRLDDMEEHREDNLRASAEGAARGAGEAAGAVATRAAAVVASNASKPFLKTWVGRVVVACSAFTALITALGVVPNVLKALELFWNFIRGLAK